MDPVLEKSVGFSGSGLKVVSLFHQSCDLCAGKLSTFAQSVLNMSTAVTKQLSHRS